MFLINLKNYVDIEMLSFNPCFRWTMFLIPLIKIESCQFFCFNPYFNWTMFLILNHFADVSNLVYVSILILTGQCFLQHFFTYSLLFTYSTTENTSRFSLKKRQFFPTFFPILCDFPMFSAGLDKEFNKSYKQTFSISHFPQPIHNYL